MVDIVEIPESAIKFQEAYKAFMDAKPDDAKVKFEEMRDAFGKLPKNSDGRGLEENIEFGLPSMKPIARGLSSLLGKDSPSDDDISKTKDTASLIDILSGLKDGKNDLGEGGYENLSSLIDGKNFDEKAIQEALGLENPISIKKEKDGTIIIEVSAEDIGKFEGKKIDKDGKATPTQEKGEVEKDAAKKDAVKQDDAGTDDKKDDKKEEKKEEKPKSRDPRDAFPSFEKLGGFAAVAIGAAVIFPPLLPLAAVVIAATAIVAAVKTAVEVVGAVVDLVVGIAKGVKAVAEGIKEFASEVKDIGGKVAGLFSAIGQAIYKGVTGKNWDDKTPNEAAQIGNKAQDEMNKAKDEGKGLGEAVKKGVDTVSKEADKAAEKANKLQRDNLEKDLKGKGASESQIKGVMDALEKSQKDPSLENKLALANAKAGLEKDLKENAKGDNKVTPDLAKQEAMLAEASKAPIPEPITPAKSVASELSNPSIAQKQEANRNLLAEGLKGRGASDKQVEAAVAALKDVHEGKSEMKDFNKTMAGINKDLEVEGKVREGVEDQALADKTVKALRGEGELSAEDAKKAMAAMANKDGPKPVNLSPKEAFEAMKAQANKDDKKSVSPAEGSLSSPVGTASKSEPAAKPKEPLGAGQEAATKPEKTSAAALDLATTSKNSDVVKALADASKSLKANKEAEGSKVVDNLDLATPSKPASKGRG